MRNRNIGKRPGGPPNGPPPRAPPAPEPDEEARRHTLLFMLEDLDEDRRKIEQARREWTRAFDAIRDPVFIHDADFRIVRANHAYAERASSDLPGILGRPYWEVFPRRSGPLALCKVATEDKQDSVTEEFTLDSGETFVSRAFVIRDAERRFLYAVHVLEDVTERRKAEAERRILSEALRQSAAGLILLNTDMSFRYANPAASGLVGYEPGQLDGKPLATVVPENMRERTPAIRAAVDATGSWTGEVTLAARDGTQIPAYLSAAAITDASGKTFAYVGSWLDLRPIKQAQQALAASEARFRLLTENSSDFVSVVTADGNLRYVSPPVQRLLGYAPGEVVGRHVSEFLHPEDIAEAQAAIARSLAEPEAIQTLRHRLRHKDGSWRSFETLGRNLLDEPAVGGLVLNSRDITERELAEQALLDEKLFSEQAIESLPGTFYLVDAGGRFVRWNRNLEIITGYSHEEIGRMQPVDFFVEADRQYVAERFAEVFEKGESTAEASVATKDGRRIPFFLSGRRTELAGRVCLIGMGIDISARVQAQEALAASEQRFRSLIERSSDIVALLGHDAGIRYFSPSAQRLLGYAAEELIGTDGLTLVHPDDLPRARQTLARILGDPGQVYHLELRLRRKDGEYLHMELVGRNLLGDPAVGGLVLNIRDITERKRAESKLRESEQRFRSLFESAADMIFLIGPQGLILQTNPSGLRLSGYTEAEIVGHSLREFFTPASQRIFDEQFPVLSARGANRQEIEFVCKTGAVRTMDCQASAVRDETGTNRFFVVYERDITERKQAEGALQQTLRRIQAQLQAVGAVAMSEALIAGEFEEFARVVTETAAGVAGVERANVWLFNDDETELRCIDLYEATPARHSSGTVLARSQFESEFRAIIGAKYVDADDPLTDPRTAGYVEGYLKPSRITSMLGALIHVSGRNLGLLCFEHVDQPHHWERDEIAFATRLADMLALTLINRERLQAEQGRQRLLKQLRENLEDTLSAIAATVEMRDPYTAGHEKRVALLATAIAREMGLPEDTIDGIHFGSLIHDLGKVKVPAEILSKPGALTPSELGLVKEHAQAGYDILKDIKFPWPVARMALEHHERIDGTGYPRGLKGEEILLEARILAVADVVEAMASHRPYRPAYGLEAALAEIEQHRGEWYDPAVVDACVRLFREKDFRFS